MIDTIERIFNAVDTFLWGPWLLIPLLMGTGMILTWKLRVVQLRKLLPALRFAFIERNEAGSQTGDISHYQALTTAMAATVGVGNVVGVATAISAGGPGALFWMWVAAFFGMASKYSEAFLAVRFRRTDDKGEQSGGPQYYLQKAIPGRTGVFLSIFFAITAIFASFGVGNITQANSVAAQLHASFGVSQMTVGIFLAIIIGCVLLGGIKAIGQVTAGFVPLMILLYVGGTFIIVGQNIASIPSALGMVFSDAFTGSGAIGGFAGSTFLLAMRYGVARGIFSNESGMGSAAIAAAAAKTRHPTRQGLVSMTQTFVDTFIVVTCTGLVLLTTGVWKEEGLTPANMTAEAFSRGLPGEWGHYLVSISVAFLAFSTILGWAYYGERCVERLVGVRGIMFYRMFFTCLVVVGATTTIDIAWTFADIANGLIAVPNLIGLIILSGLVARETAAYLKQDPDLRLDPRSFNSVPDDEARVGA